MVLNLNIPQFPEIALLYGSYTNLMIDVLCWWHMVHVKNNYPVKNENPTDCTWSLTIKIPGSALIYYRSIYSIEIIVIFLGRMSFRIKFDALNGSFKFTVHCYASNRRWSDWNGSSAYVCGVLLYLLKLYFTFFPCFPRSNSFGNVSPTRTQQHLQPTRTRYNLQSRVVWTPTFSKTNAYTVIIDWAIVIIAWEWVRPSIWFFCSSEIENDKFIRKPHHILYKKKHIQSTHTYDDQKRECNDRVELDILTKTPNLNR